MATLRRISRRRSLRIPCLAPVTRDDPDRDEDTSNNEPSASQTFKGQYITLFKPEIPMTPIIALPRSAYVTDGFFFDSVGKAAYAILRDGKPHMECNLVLNEAFIPRATPKPFRIQYLGFQYPDGTSLSYVPVRDAILQHRSTEYFPPTSFSVGLRESAVYGRDYVYLSVPKLVYRLLVEKAETALKDKYANIKSKPPDADERGDRVWLFNIEMMPSCKVQGLENGRKYARSVTQALKEFSGNLEGDVLLYMRYCEDPHAQGGEPKLQFRFHRMLVKGVSRY